MMSTMIRVCAIVALCATAYSQGFAPAPVVLVRRPVDVGAGPEVERQARQDGQIAALDQRVARIEAVRPEALAQQVSSMATSLNRVENVLIALVVAVIGNIIASYTAQRSAPGRRREER